MIAQQTTIPPQSVENKKRSFWLSLPVWWVGLTLAYFLVPFVNQSIAHIPVVGTLWIGIFRAFGGILGKVFAIVINGIGLFVPVGFRFFFLAYSKTVIPLLCVFLFVLIVVFFMERLLKKRALSSPLRIGINLLILFVLTFIVDIFTTGCWASWDLFLGANWLSGGVCRLSSLRIFLRGILPWL